MKLRNIDLSLLLLLGLIFLSLGFFVVANENSNSGFNVFLDSDQDGLTDEEEKLYGTDPRKADTDKDGYSDWAEISSGYDPKKPAPGDKLFSENGSLPQSSPTPNVAGEFTDKNENDNITAKVSKEISSIATETDLENNPLDMDGIQSIVDSALSGKNEVQLPEFSKDDVKIKEQPYKNLSEEKAKEKMSEDCVDYLIAVYYILSSNSPTPITSSSNLMSMATTLPDKIISAISSRDASSLEDISRSGEKSLEQLQEIEVPEDLVDIHLKSLQIAAYSMTLKDALSLKENDPLGDILNLSKIQNFVNISSDFSVQLQSKFLEYDLTYDEKTIEKIEKAGLFAPKEDELPLTEDSEK